LHAVAMVLLPSPAISGRLDDWRANGLAPGDIDSFCDYQNFPRLAQQSRASHALGGAMAQESFSGFRKWTGTMPSEDAGILE
jgi:hypothetical protein